MKTTETFYRLTEEDKERLIERCREELEDEELCDTERMREILEELLETRDDTDLQYWKTRAGEAEEENRTLRIRLEAETLETEKLRREKEYLNEQCKESEQRKRDLQKELEQFGEEKRKGQCWWDAVKIACIMALFLMLGGIVISLFPA